LVRHEHFNARSPEKKAKSRERDADLRKQIATMLQKDGGFPGGTASMLAAWDPYDQNKAASFFDPPWMFSIKDGFDIVVGNPPYVRQEQIKDIKPRLKTHYDCYTGTADLYVYFYERGIQLLRLGGVFSFITSNKWFRAAYGEPLRGWLTRHTRLRHIIDFGDAPVFTSIAYPCIVILTREEQTDQRAANGKLTDHVRALNWQPGSPVEQFIEIFRQQSFTVPQTSLKPDGWRLESAIKLKLLDRIRSLGTSLGEYAKGRFYWGIKTGLNEAFVIDRAIRDRLLTEHSSSAEVIKPCLRGKDVKRWRVEPQDCWLLFVPWHFPLHIDPSIKGASQKAEKEFEKRYPAVYTYLRGFKKELSSRNSAETGIRYEWYALQRWGAEYWQEFEQPKIIVPAIADTVNFAPDWQGFYSNNKTSICVPPSIPVALAAANSQIAFWFAQQTFATKQGGFYDFEPRYSSQIRIPPTTKQQEELISRIVNYLMWLNRPESELGSEWNNSREPLTLGYFEQLLNSLVYELFFPDELHVQKLFLFKYVEEAKLPVLSKIPEAKRLTVLQETFERIYDLNHPIRGCLFSLGSLETVRIIEGEA